MIEAGGTIEMPEEEITPPPGFLRVIQGHRTIPSEPIAREIGHQGVRAFECGSVEIQTA